MTKVGATFPIVNDDQDVAKQLFAVTGTPTNLMLDEAGRVFFRRIGYAPGYEKAYAAEIEYLLARSSRLGMLGR